MRTTLTLDEDVAALLHKEVRKSKIFHDVEPVGLPWKTVCAFLRAITNRKLPGSRLTVLKRMILEGRASGPLVSDADLVVLTLQYGGVLHTTDRDFARFPGLRWKNPLE